MPKRLPKKAWKTKNTNGVTQLTRITSYNVCYTKLLRGSGTFASLIRNANGCNVLDSSARVSFMPMKNPL